MNPTLFRQSTLRSLRHVRPGDCGVPELDLNGYQTVHPGGQPSLQRWCKVWELCIRRPLDDDSHLLGLVENRCLAEPALDRRRRKGELDDNSVSFAVRWQHEVVDFLVLGLDLLDRVDYDAVSALIEDLTSKYAEMSVIKSIIELQEHKEQSRGVSLVLARIRLVTDRGYFSADAEGYGASHALRLAANKVERQILKGKTYEQSERNPDSEAQERLYGWWLGG